MKNKIIMLTLASIAAINAQAQTPIAVGARGGINYTKTITDGNSKVKFAPSLILALPVELGITKSFFIQPEFTMIQKGGEYDLEGTDEMSRVLTNYVELPILAKYKIGGERLKGYAILGPTFGYATQRNVHTGKDGDWNSEKLDFVDSGNVQDNRFDLGATAGIGGELTVGSGAIVIDARYGFDFNDNFKIDGDEPSGYGKTYNSGIGITLGYMYRF